MRERFSKIFEIPIQDIYTNPKMFQNKNEEFSKSTYEKIMREGFDKSENPIIVWRDNKTNKYFVISGHSRLKAAQTLYNNGDDNLTTLPVKEFLGDLEGAISYATLESNRSGTPEGLLADVRAYKKAIKESCNKECLKGLFKTESYISTLQRLSYLDENGEFLRILNDAGQAKNFANIQKYAEWTGELRKYYEDKLTDKHEKEIFDFLFTESNKLFRKDEFVNLIEKAINHVTFEPSKPLNLKNFHSKSVYQIYAETEAEQVQKEIEELRDLLEKKQKLLARTEKEERQKEIELEISGINRNIVKKLESLDRLKEQAKEADKMQLDLFAPPAEKEEKNIQKTPKEQPKTPKIEQIETTKPKERPPIIEEEKPKKTKEQTKEQQKKQTPSALRDVESTAKALEGKDLKSLVEMAYKEKEKDFVNLTTDEVKKIINSNNISKIDQVAVSRYIKNKYGKPSSEQFINKIKEDYSPIEVIHILNIVGADEFKDSFESNLKNPSSLSYIFTKVNRDDAINIIENYEYYENAVKANPSKQNITISLREYPNGMKEGVTIKKEPYSSSFIVNVYWIEGDFVYDKTKNIAEGGVQKSQLFRLQSLPNNKREMVETIMSYDYILNNEKGKRIVTDISTYQSYPTAKEYWSQKGNIAKLHQKIVAEAYHKAKKDGSNPELVQAVESLLSKEQPKEQPKEQTKEQPKTPKQDKKTLASIQKRIENLQIILSLNKKDTKIKQRIKDLELINAL